RVIQKHETSRTDYQRIETVKDSIRVSTGTIESSERSGSEVDQSFIRITEFDSTGTVRRIQETWRDRQRIDLVAEERSGRTVSVKNTDQQITIRDTTSTITNEVKEVNTDSRPIQGLEWFWVVLSGVLVLTVIIYIIYNRIK
ncbi:MAG: hypothetical protein PHV53_11175, partial [Fermentimonas sp.]|nr:hypothetical protein [Fermentimonas sp.]